ncbi:MAG: 1-deoxy-D-xylulose-5-phosphate synthase [Paludibacteraceae bacterium]|nr:1-deoxy-D-xylulose-5-phosphate synthase [Paludibacteraceae bacterium]
MESNGVKSDVKYPLLSGIEYPADLRRLTVDQLPQVCDELRSFIIDQLSVNPGHLASSLGVVELTVALHYVFNTPDDCIVWDVGHQAYGHKILTGRRAVFNTNRKYKGISGFPNPAESRYDAFIAGHASNSVSAALGLSIASERLHHDHKVVAVIGDGAMTGGLAFEGLNNVCVNPNNLLIILNDNNMSIDTPVGGMSEYLMAITTSPAYNRIRFRMYHWLKKLGLMTDNKRNRILRMANSFKNWASGSHNIFEGLNIRYFGQLDGHDVRQMVKILNDIKNFQGPRVLHIKTVKGKGFAPAEQAATIWHAPGLFNPVTGERKKSAPQASRYQDVFGETLLELARRDERVVGITPAMPTGCSMTILQREMPDRVYDVGIAEGHAVTFSAGLAKEGLLPYCNIYSSFMQRAYDGIIHDVALQNLHVVLCLDRAGLVGADGPTHHGAFDMAYLRPIPNLTIASPLNELDLRNLLYTASLPSNGPFVIRYPRGCGEGVEWHKDFEETPIGKGVAYMEGDDLAMLTIGPIGNVAGRVAQRLCQAGVSTGWYDMRFLKPLDTDLLAEVTRRYRRIATIEDGSLNGGFDSAVLEALADMGVSMPVKRIGLPDRFVEHGSPADLYHVLGMDEEGMFNSLNAWGM